MPRFGKALVDDPSRDLERLDRIEAPTLGPAPEKAGQPTIRASLLTQRPIDDHVPIGPPKLAERLEHDLPNDSSRARVAEPRQRQNFRLAPSFIQAARRQVARGTP